MKFTRNVHYNFLFKVANQKKGATDKFDIMTCYYAIMRYEFAIMKIVTITRKFQLTNLLICEVGM